MGAKETLLEEQKKRIYKTLKDSTPERVVLKLWSQDPFTFLKVIGTPGFPGGPVVKIPPCHARDTSLIPSPERFHMPWSNYTCASQLLNQHSRAYESQLLKPAPRACALQQKNPPQWAAHMLQPRVAPAYRN